MVLNIGISQYDKGCLQNVLYSKLDKQLVELVENAAEQESLALSASSMLTDDGIIDPRDTRNVLGFCLSAIDNSTIKGADGYGVFRL